VRPGPVARSGSPSRIAMNPIISDGTHTEGVQKGRAADFSLEVEAKLAAIADRAPK